MNTRSIFRLLPLLAFALAPLACVGPDDSADVEEVDFAQDAVMAFDDPTALKDAITNGATYNNEFRGFNVGNAVKYPVLADGVWTLEDEGLPLIDTTFNFIGAGTVLTEQGSIDLFGVPDGSGLIYTAAVTTYGTHTFEPSFFRIASGTYPQNSGLTGTFCKLSDP